MGNCHGELPSCNRLDLVYVWLILGYHWLFWICSMCKQPGKSRDGSGRMWSPRYIQCWGHLLPGAIWENVVVECCWCFFLEGFFLAQFVPLCHAWIMEYLGCCIFMQFKFLALLSSSLASVIVYLQPFLSNVGASLPCLLTMSLGLSARWHDVHCSQDRATWYKIKPLGGKIWKANMSLTNSGHIKNDHYLGWLYPRFIMIYHYYLLFPNISHLCIKIIQHWSDMIRLPHCILRYS